MPDLTKFWNNFSQSFITYLPKLIGAIVVTAIGILIMVIIVHLTRKAMQRKGVDPSLISFICKATRILILIFTLIAAMTTLDISVTGVIAFFSAAAAAIALALKDRLNDIASGIVILFTKPFVTGDFIEFDNYKGFVQKIDVTHTNILTYNRTNVIVPNSVIASSKVNNYTSQPVIRVQVNVPIPYDADIDQVKQILLDSLKDVEHLVHDEEHVDSVNLENFGDSALEFSVRCFCEFKDYWPVYYSVMQRTKEALDKEGITIPFNQLDVHLVK